MTLKQSKSFFYKSYVCDVLISQLSTHSVKVWAWATYNTIRAILVLGSQRSRTVFFIQAFLFTAENHRRTLNIMNEGVWVSNGEKPKEKIIRQTVRYPELKVQLNKNKQKIMKDGIKLWQRNDIQDLATTKSKPPYKLKMLTESRRHIKSRNVAKLSRVGRHTFSHWNN